MCTDTKFQEKWRDFKNQIPTILLILTMQQTVINVWTDSERMAFTATGHHMRVQTEQKFGLICKNWI
jgi:hypothetical protein